MESSPCLSSPSQTLSVQINTHGGALEGCWQLLEMSHTQQMHPPSLAKGSWLLRIPLKQDDDEHKLHRNSCFTDGTWPERDHAISEMYFEWGFLFLSEEGVVSNIWCTFSLWTAGMYYPKVITSKCETELCNHPWSLSSIYGNLH